MHSRLVKATDLQSGVEADWAEMDPDVSPPFLSAASFSFAFHVVLFLLLAFAFPPSSSIPETEPERPVQIVLARRESVSQTRYHHEADAEFERTKLVDSFQLSAPGGGTTPSETQIADAIPAELALPTPSPTPSPTSSPGGEHGASSFLGARTGAGRVPLIGDLGKVVAEEQARLRAGRPAGEPAAIQIFGGQAAVGRSFLFLIDRSKSMGQDGLGALQAAEAELLIALQPLQPFHQFQVIAYHHECVFLNRRALLPATDAHKQAVRGFLSGLAAFGATEHEMALRTALAHKPDVIYLLTDGGDPELSEGQIRNLTKLAAGKTTIHCVRFGFGARASEDHFLQRLARQNGGGFVYIDVSRLTKSP